MLQAQGHRATSGASESRERIGGVVLMEPKHRQGLTTGEASKILGISIRTVIRYFDKGIFTGSKHPSTGRRVIGPKSVKAFEALKQKQIVAVRKFIDDLAKR